MSLLFEDDDDLEIIEFLNHHRRLYTLHTRIDHKMVPSYYDEMG